MHVWVTLTRSCRRFRGRSTSSSRMPTGVVQELPRRSLAEDVVRRLLHRPQRLGPRHRSGHSGVHRSSQSAARCRYDDRHFEPGGSLNQLQTLIVASGDELKLSRRSTVSADRRRSRPDSSQSSGNVANVRPASAGRAPSPFCHVGDLNPFAPLCFMNGRAFGVTLDPKHSAREGRGFAD
jgi:hypothetical protein